MAHLLSYKSEVEILRDKNFVLGQEKATIEKAYEEEIKKLKKELEGNIEWEESRPSSKVKSSRKQSHKK